MALSLLTARESHKQIASLSGKKIIPASLLFQNNWKEYVKGGAFSFKYVMPIPQARALGVPGVRFPSQENPNTLYLIGVGSVSRESGSYETIIIERIAPEGILDDQNPMHILGVYTHPGRAKNVPVVFYEPKIHRIEEKVLESNRGFTGETNVQRLKLMHRLNTQIKSVGMGIGFTSQELEAIASE